MEPTLYDVLGVSRAAGPDRVRAAWREAADAIEPGEGSAQRLRRVNEAAEVLLDPERRAAYDATLAQPPSAEETTAHGEGPSGATPWAEETTTEDEGPAGVVPGPPMPGASSAAAPAGAVGAPGTAGGVVDDAATPAPTASGASAVPVAPAGRDSVSGRSVALLAVLAVLALVAVALGAYLGTQGWRSYQEDRRAERFQEALDRAPSAAENAAAAVLSYGHRSLEADRDAAARFLTEDYREDYLETFDELVVDSATRTKATVEAAVLASAPMNSPRERPDRVPVLVFVNQTTTSSASTEPRVALNRVQLDMVEVDGAWLVDGITSY